MAYKHLKIPKDSLFLVTGGAGFIGSNLCEAILNLGYRVRCQDDYNTITIPEHTSVYKPKNENKLNVVVAATLYDIKHPVNVVKALVLMTDEERKRYIPTGMNEFRQFGELGDVLADKIPGRENDKERILSYNIGLGLFDIYFAHKILNMIG